MFIAYDITAGPFVCFVCVCVWEGLWSVCLCVCVTSLSREGVVAIYRFSILNSLSMDKYGSPQSIVTKVSPNIYHVTSLI